MVEVFNYFMALPYLLNELLGTYGTAVGISVVVFSLFL
jgi:hypothetical protein